MIDTIGRARIIGVLVLILAFGAGIAVGHWYWPVRNEAGVTIKVTGSTRIPEELEALALTDAQRERIRVSLHAGTERVGRVLRSFMTPMDAAIDSTDREIRALLTEAQNRQLDVFRKDHPLKRMQEKRIIDTVRKR